MQKKLVIWGLFALCLLCVALCWGWGGHSAGLTLLHGQEMEQALQHYWDVCHSIGAFKEPSHLSEVMTGEFLTSTMRLYSTFIDEPFQDIPCQVTAITVEEYSDECSRVSAQIICGKGWGAYSGNSGQYIFLQKDGKWKVVSFWQWLDTHNTLWPSSPPPTCKDFLSP